jgi:hypothetical protein
MLWLAGAHLLCAGSCQQQQSNPSTSEAAVSPSTPSADFSPLRPAILGHRLLHDAEHDVYRLVDEHSGAVLAEGDHDHCNEVLVQRLLDRYGDGHPNLALPTLGARQFWADVFWFADWRIQENVLSGHHRLLDDQDRRRAWGSREACRAVFERERLELRLAPEAEHLVLLLHGLARDRTVWEPMQRALLEAGYDVAALAYPSTRRSISEHAAQLSELLGNLDGLTQVSFVTHSLGALVVRAAMQNDVAWMDRLPPHRVVMLAPPSRGSSLAQALVDFSPFALIAGPAGQELARQELADLAAPPCEFGIIAAGRGDEHGFNPWLEGDDDGVVAVEETRLAGAKDFLLLESLHTFVMKDAEAIAATLSFLSSGRFTPSDDDDQDD